jgi:hypothetical protein
MYSINAIKLNVNDLAMSPKVQLSHKSGWFLFEGHSHQKKTWGIVFGKKINLSQKMSYT